MFAYLRKGGTQKFDLQLMPESMLGEPVVVRPEGKGPGSGRLTIGVTDVRGNVLGCLLSAREVGKPRFASLTRDTVAAEVGWGALLQGGVDQEVPALMYAVELVDAFVARHASPTTVKVEAGGSMRADIRVGVPIVHLRVVVRSNSHASNLFGSVNVEAVDGTYKHTRTLDATDHMSWWIPQSRYYVRLGMAGYDIQATQVEASDKTHVEVEFDLRRVRPSGRVR